MARNEGVRRPPLAIVFGGGGGYGFGFDRGVADGLQDEGVELFAAPVMGTSAGAITAASLLSGQPFSEVADIWEATTTAHGHRWRLPVIDMTTATFGDVSPDRFPARLLTVATELPRYRRVVMGTDRFSIPDMVAASCSIPPVARTHVIDGVRYGDGGLVSSSSIDLAPDVDLLVAVTPMSRPVKGMAGRYNSWQTRRESAKWTRRTGGEVLHIPPTEEIAAVFSSSLAKVASVDQARRVYDLSRAYGRSMADQIRSRSNATIDA